MKTTKSIIAVLFVLLTAQIASAYYCPSTGRWLSRDPVDEQGVEALQKATQANSMPSSSSRWISRDSIGNHGGANIYGFVDNCPPDKTDFLGQDTNVYPGGDPLNPWPYMPPPYQNPHQPPQRPPSCKEACVLKYVLGIEVDTTIIVSGQPIIQKRFILPGSASGTSIAGQMTDAILQDAQLPGRLPTISGGWKCCRIAYTKSASRFVSRWIPIVGWVMLDYDVSGLAGCVCGCPKE